MTVEKKATSAKEARMLGLKRYFTGVPCVNGHVSQRRAKDSTCRACESKSKKRRIQRKKLAGLPIPAYESRKAKRAARRQLLATTPRTCTRCKLEKFETDFRCTPRTKHPEWCVKCRKNYDKYTRSLASGRYAQMMVRRALAEKRQTPRWAKNKPIEQVYAYARFLRQHGIDCHVDHIVPLRGDRKSVV